jgi:hypothetical protein
MITSSKRNKDDDLLAAIYKIISHLTCCVVSVMNGSMVGSMCSCQLYTSHHDVLSMLRFGVNSSLDVKAIIRRAQIISLKYSSFKIFAHSMGPLGRYPLLVTFRVS